MNSKIFSIIELLNEVDGKIAQVGYKYQNIEEFKKIKRIEERQLIYWSEMLQRYHFSCATSLMRLKKWFELLQLSYEAENYYGFCTALRGIIEACSDSFYLFGKVTYTFADNFAHIKEAVIGKSKQTILSSEAEDELIHYMYARKLSKAEKKDNPDSHSAKFVSKYLENMKSEKLNELYSELCQVSHPSMMSLIPFIAATDEHAIILHNENADGELNKNILERFGDTIYDSVILAVIPALTGLRIINILESDLLSSLKTDDSAFTCLDGSDFWEDVKQRLKG